VDLVVNTSGARSPPFGKVDSRVLEMLQPTSFECILSKKMIVSIYAGLGQYIENQFLFCKSQSFKHEHQDIYNFTKQCVLSNSSHSIALVCSSLVHRTFHVVVHH
jgi:hypothetical protein